MEVQNIYKYSILCLVSECPKVATMTWINSYNFNCNHIYISNISTVLLCILGLLILGIFFCHHAIQQLKYTSPVSALARAVLEGVGGVPVIAVMTQLIGPCS